MKRWHIISLSAVFVIGVFMAVGYHIGVRMLQGRIVEALGPGSSIAELKVTGFRSKS